MLLPRRGIGLSLVNTIYQMEIDALFLFCFLSTNVSYNPFHCCCIITYTGSIADTYLDHQQKDWWEKSTACHYKMTIYGHLMIITIQTA